MGWNGSGTFNRSDGTRSGTQVWQDAKTAGVKIRADDHDVHDQDIADGLENTVALDGQTTTTTDNAILRYDSGNTKFEGVTISASQLVGRSATGDTRGMSAATARQTIGVGSAAPTNNQFLYWASASSQYVQAAAATARSLIGLGTAAPTNNQVLAYSSSASMYQQTLVDTANIATDAVTADKIAAGAVDSSEIATDAVTQTKIATGAVGSGAIATGAVGSAEIADGSVGSAEIDASAVGQGELKSTNGTVSHTGNTNVTHKTMPGGAYGFYPRTKIDNSASTYNANIANQHNGTSFATIIALSVASGARTVSANQTYIQASPPYDMGDGECGLFIEADVLADGSLGGLYVAPDPVWANNGSTNIRPDRIDKKTGRKYKRVRRPAVTLADVDAGTADLADYIAAQAEAVVEEVEITHAYKNADMELIPHSWASPPQGTICLLDPVNTHDLLMLHEAGEDVADLIHKGYIKVGDKVNRKGPPGVTPVSWKWK